MTRYFVAMGYEPSRPLLEVTFRPGLLGLLPGRVEYRRLTEDPKEDWSGVVRRALEEGAIYDFETHRNHAPPHTRWRASFERAIRRISADYRSLLVYPADAPPPPPVPGLRKREIDEATYAAFADFIGIAMYRGKPGRFDLMAVMRDVGRACTPEELVEKARMVGALDGINLSVLRESLRKPGLDEALVRRLLQALEEGEEAGGWSSYECADCKRRFDAGPDHAHPCPGCGQTPGRGLAACACGTRFPVDMPHWHRHCNLSNGSCPACGKPVVEPCIC